MQHHDEALRETPIAAWLEVHAENYLSPGLAQEELCDIANRHPLSVHAVGLSLGSADGADLAHVRSLRRLVGLIQPGLVSDHLSWSRSGRIHLPDLLPLPYTREALNVVVDNVNRVQDALGMRMLIENPSVYLSVTHDMGEAEFLALLGARTGCGVLLDVNNIYVSALNRRTEPFVELESFLSTLDPATVGEIHLAGHSVVDVVDGERLHIDDHGSRVCEDVWTMFAAAVGVIGRRPTLIEWDTAIPSLSVIQGEAVRAAHILHASEGLSRVSVG